MKTVEKLLDKAVNTDLCCHCGACAGVCPVGAINIQSNALSADIDKCVNCGLCTYVCPADGYTLSDLTIGDIVDVPKYMACAKDQDVTEKASSGGFVTQALLSLLDSGDITAAAVVVPGASLNEPSAKYIVTSNREDILAARRSKYTQASIDYVLEHIKKNEGRYAVVGLPCQLYALTQAMEKLPALRSRIVYKIGMVCGYTYEESCIDGLLKVLKTSRNDTASIIGWREGGLPGNFAVKLNNGDVLSMPFADEHSVDVTYYAQNRCLMCKDCLCEYGDVVCADIGGWSKRKTLVMTRTLNGHKLMDNIRNSRSVEIEPCNIPFEKTVLPFMLREKRSKVDIRIKRKRKQAASVTGFTGGYSPKLLLAQKIEASQSIKLQEFARKNRDNHSPDKMLAIGHKSYHKLSERFFLKVLYKLEYYTKDVLKKVQALLWKVKQKTIGTMPSISDAMVDKPLKVAVIGLGRWGSQYLPILTQSAQYKLVAAYDNDRQKLEAYGKRYGFGLAANVDHLCKGFGAEAVLVLSPTPTHASIFSQIAEYQLPVYIEKPIASTSEDANDMIAMANEHKLLLYVAHSMKYEPAIQIIKERLDSDELGKLTAVKIARTVKSRNDVYYPDAPLYQIGVHLVDVVLYLLGAEKDCEKLCRYAVDNIDNVSFRYGDTAVRLQYGFGTLYNFSLQIIGENGYISFADGILTTVIGDKSASYRIPMLHEKTVLSQLNEFYCAVRMGEPFLNTKENAERIMLLCEKISKSGESL